LSTLYLRGRRVWIGYSDRWGLRHRVPLGIDLDKVEHRNGRIVWPREIQELKRKFDVQLAAGRYDLDPGRDHDMKLSEVLEHFMDGYGKDRSTASQYQYRLSMGKLIDCFGDIPAAALQESDILSWSRSLMKGDDAIGEHTAAKDLRSISPVFAWATAKGMILRNPVTRYVKFTPKAKPIVPFSRDQLETIFSSVDEPARNQFRFLLLSGFRLGESCALRWEDVDFAQKVIRLWNKKEQRWDYFPMDRELERFMKDLSREYSPFVFIYRKIGTASQRFRRLRERLGYSEELSLHTLRTNFISTLINSGASESEVMHLARHRSIVTTHKYYTAFDQKRMREALGKSRAREYMGGGRGT
jgi:integrase